MRRPYRLPDSEPLELFHPRPVRPMWQQLPRPIAQRVSELLARLFHEHLGRGPVQADAGEARHE
jgi:hypothetical protein